MLAHVWTALGCVFAAQAAILDRAPVRRAVVVPLDPAALVTAYNSRALGSRGWRRVTLQLSVDGRVLHSLSVVNLWRRESDEVRTVFYLEQPAGLRGTTYLLVERNKEVNGMTVHLHLPVGDRRILVVSPKSFDEGLLGSDFSYRDLRMLIPQFGQRFRVTGDTSLIGHRVWMIDADPQEVPDGSGSTTPRRRYYLAADLPLLLGFDVYGESRPGNSVSVPVKRMRVLRVTKIRGVWTPTQIVMRTHGGRTSTLVLVDADFSEPGWDESLFEADRLPQLSERVRSGWTPSRDSANTQGRTAQ